MKDGIANGFKLVEKFVKLVFKSFAETWIGKSVLMFSSNVQFYCSQNSMIDIKNRSHLKEESVLGFRQ